MYYKNKISYKEMRKNRTLDEFSEEFEDEKEEE